TNAKCAVQLNTVKFKKYFTSNAIYNFLFLQSYFHSPESLQPIILLLERKPNLAFIDFPLVYLMMGCIDNLDDLKQADINIAECHFVKPNRFYPLANC
ncbi:potassium channel subfamily T member 1-like protein, partial [Leptotrombidium deliense]